MPKMNCWQYRQCGREPGGARSEELGVCPAATDARFDGANEGTNGGRCCWVVAGTLCGGDVQGTYADKYKACMECSFYKLVCDEGEKESAG